MILQDGKHKTNKVKKGWQEAGVNGHFGHVLGTKAGRRNEEQAGGGYGGGAACLVEREHGREHGGLEQEVSILGRLEPLMRGEDRDHLQEDMRRAWWRSRRACLRQRLCLVASLWKRTIVR